MDGWVDGQVIVKNAGLMYEWMKQYLKVWMDGWIYERSQWMQGYQNNRLVCIHLIQTIHPFDTYIKVKPLSDKALSYLCSSHRHNRSLSGTDR